MTGGEIDVQPDRLSMRVDGDVVALTARVLRDACRCAPCRAAQRAGCVAAQPESVRIAASSFVGAYGVQLCFSDGHDRGIYPFVYLRELARRRDLSTHRE